MPSGRDSCPTQSSRWLAGLIAGPKDPELSVVKTFPLQSHPHLGKRGGDREQGFGWPSPLLVSDEDTEDWAPSWPGAPGSFLGASSQRLQGGLQAGGPRALPNTALHDLLQEPALLPTTGLQGGGAPGISIWAQPGETFSDRHSSWSRWARPLSQGQLLRPQSGPLLSPDERLTAIPASLLTPARPCCLISAVEGRWKHC